MNYRSLLLDSDVAIITSPASLYYLSGFDQSDATIVITKDAAYYLTNALYEIAVKTAVRSDLSIRIMTTSEKYAFLSSLVSTARKVAVEYGDMTLSLYHTLALEEKETVDISLLISDLREIKKTEEIEIIRRAENIVDTAFAEVRPILKEGVTELEIKEALRLSMVRHGAQETAFDTIVAFGEDAAMPHAVSSDRKLKKGDCILMDFGAKAEGYMSDFTRTLFFGEPSAKFRAAYDVVLRAQLAAIRYIEEGGRSAREADRVARAIIDGSAFRGLFTHTLGHGVGIEIHESPALSQASRSTLSNGMVFTIEPGVYLEGEFGIRIESLCVIENGKLTVLDRSDKENYTV